MSVQKKKQDDDGTNKSKQDTQIKLFKAKYIEKVWRNSRTNVSKSVMSYMCWPIKTG